MKTVNYSYLQNLNTIMDCPCGCRIKIADELLSINYKLLSAYLQIEYCYIAGKFYYYQSKVSDLIENLEKSNEYFDKISIISDSTRTEFKCPKKFFKRAHTKYVLSQSINNKEEAKYLLEKASNIVDAALRKFPMNSSISWLRNEIDSNFDFQN